MLVLTRKEGQSVVIDGSIVVTVVRIRDKSCSIGIEAPRSVVVHRAEVMDRIQQENDRPDDHN